MARVALTGGLATGRSVQCAKAAADATEKGLTAADTDKAIWDAEPGVEGGYALRRDWRGVHATKLAA